MKTLVTCYSLTGHTREVAEKAAAALGADIEFLRDMRARPGFLGYLKLAHDTIRDVEPELAPPKYDPVDYDLVVLAGPIWSSRMCSPVRAYASHHKDRLGRTAILCTSRSSELGYAERSMAGMIKSAGLAPVVILGLGHRELKQGYLDAITHFASAVNAADEKNAGRSAS